jgi:multidrug efflux pump subunit AcrA (membrane-fusion protein)
MADPVEELIQEIAAKHGIAVSREDPIFVLHTMNQRLLQDSAKAQQAMLDQYKAELEAIAQAWGNDAKAKAERVLNAAMSASKEAAAKIMHEGATAAAASVRGEIDAALGRLAGTLRHARRLAMVNLVASALTLMAAGLALRAMLQH